MYMYTDPDGDWLKIDREDDPAGESEERSSVVYVCSLHESSGDGNGIYVLPEHAGTVAAELLKAADVREAGETFVRAAGGHVEVTDDGTRAHRRVRPEWARKLALSLLLAADEAERKTYDEEDLAAVNRIVDDNYVTGRSAAKILQALESRGWKKEAA